MSSRPDGPQGIDGMAAIQLARYALVGLLAVAVHYAALIALVEFAAIGKVLASIVGLPPGYPVATISSIAGFRRRTVTVLPCRVCATVTAIGLAINAVAFNGGLKSGSICWHRR